MSNKNGNNFCNSSCPGGLIVLLEKKFCLRDAAFGIYACFFFSGNLKSQTTLAVWISPSADFWEECLMLSLSNKDCL